MTADLTDEPIEQSARDATERAVEQAADGDLSAAVLEVAEHYLGFAAKQYLDRQCRIHLNKSLNEITREDLDDLAKWVSNTAPLIMDTDEGKELAEAISELKRA